MSMMIIMITMNMMMKKEYDDWEEDYDFYEPEVYKGHEILEPLEKKSKSDILDIIYMAIQDSRTYQVFLVIICNELHHQ